MTVLRKLKLNGHEVLTVSNQMIYDLDFNFDFGPEPVTQPTAPRAKPKCICGSWAIGVGDYMTGHDSDCNVHEDKTPVR